MSNIEVKKIAKQVMIKKNWGSILLLLILLSILIGCGNIIPLVGAIIIIGPLKLGYNYCMQTAVKGEKMDLWDLFKGFEENFGEAFLVFILKKLFLFLWTLVFIIPGFIKKYSYAMAEYALMRNPDLSAMEAIDESRALMDGHKWKAFLLDLSFIGWWILVPFTFGILAIYVKPYHEAAKIALYNSIYDEKYKVYTAPAADATELNL